MKTTYETPATLSQAVANLEDELAYYKEKVNVLTQFKDFDFNINTVVRVSHLMIDNHLCQNVDGMYDKATMKQLYIDAGFDIKSKAFNSAVLWTVMNWSSRDRNGDEDMLVYFIDKMCEIYPIYVTDNKDEQSTLRRQLSVSLNHAYKVAKLIDSY